MSEAARVTVQVKHSGKDHTVELAGDATMGDLKARLFQLTNVNPSKQKLLGMKHKGKPTVEDSAPMSEVTLPKSVMMIGTPDADIDEIVAASENAPDILDDFDVGVSEPLSLADRPENTAKLARRLAAVNLTLRNPPRPGKKLLVLDIDYTLFDHRSAAERAEELMRPYLHQFLKASYEHYDIIIWSATSMQWVELKMKELGVLSNPDYKITCLMDCLSMITVHTEKYGVFNCKPLAFIWAKFPEFYSHKNTIMFDDLRRNFVMNPQNGLKIRPFDNAHTHRATDNELLKLTQYLLDIAPIDDLSVLDHARWERYSRRREKREGMGGDDGGAGGGSGSATGFGASGSSE